MQILRTRGTTYSTCGGYLYCIAYPAYLPRIAFKYVASPDLCFLVYYSVGYRTPTPTPKSFINMPIGMSADTCIQYWDDL